MEGRVVEVSKTVENVRWIEWGKTVLNIYTHGQQFISFLKGAFLASVLFVTFSHLIINRV